MALELQLTVRTKTDKLKHIAIRFAVDENEVGLHMAVATVRPFARERMVPITYRQSHICAEQLHELVKLIRKETTVLAPGLALQVAFEARGELNRPHPDRPSGQR